MQKNEDSVDEHHEHGKGATELILGHCSTINGKEKTLNDKWNEVSSYMGLGELVTGKTAELSSTLEHCMIPPYLVGGQH